MKKKAMILLYYPVNSDNGNFDYIVDSKGKARSYTTMESLEKHMKGKIYNCIFKYTLGEIIPVI